MNAVSYNLKLDVFCSSKSDVDNISSIFFSENQKASDRSSYSLSENKTDKKISFEIVSKDITALRANLNTITTNLQIYEKSKGIKDSFVTEE